MIEIWQRAPLRVESWKEVRDIIYGEDPAGRTIVSGDEIEIECKNGEKYVLQFTWDGNGKPFFVFKDCVFRAPFGDTACWKDSIVRKELKTFFDELPNDLQEVIKPVTTRQYFNGKWIETEDNLFIPSGRQVFGWEYDDEDHEEAQFEIFKDRRNRCKSVVDADGDVVAAYWWLRSAHSNYYVSDVYSGGNYNYAGAHFTHAVCPSFSI